MIRNVIIQVLLYLENLQTTPATSPNSEMSWGETPVWMFLKPLFKTSLSGKTHHRPLQSWVGGNISDYGSPVPISAASRGLQSTFIPAPWVLYTEQLFLRRPFWGLFFFFPFQLYTKKQSIVVETVLLK